MNVHDEIIRNNPNSAKAYFNRGLDRRQDPIALEDFDEAIRLNPEFAEAYFYRGCLKDYFALREPELVDKHESLRSAVADFDDAIRLDLNSNQLAHAYYRRGEAKYNLDRYEEAMCDYNEALKLDPENSDIRSSLDEAEGILDFYNNGITHFDETIRQNPQDVRTYKIRGETKGFLGCLKEAKEDFEKIWELTSDNQLKTEIERHLTELHNPNYWQQYSWRTGN